MESAITSKGQATIPKAVREHLQLAPGDRVKFFIHPDGSVVLLPKRPATILRGIAKKRRRVVTIADGRRRSHWRDQQGIAAAVIGLDTNVLVRYFAQDDPRQSARATELIERRLTENEPGFVSLPVIAETAWVLERALGLSPAEVAAAVERILQVDVLVVESEQEVFEAMIALKQGVGSFTDALIGALARKVGCTHMVTFDRKAARLPGFKLL